MAKKNKKEMPTKFPFWARLKISKNRTTLVIDEEKNVLDKKDNKKKDMYVHRESTHSKGRGERIFPNPDRKDKEPMYLKSATRLPKTMFKLHNKKLDMPQHLIDRYSKNNKK